MARARRSRQGLDSQGAVELALGLPGTTRKDSDAWTSVAVRGKGFAWIDHGEDRAMVKSTHPERDALVGSAPEVYSAGWATQSSAWVNIELAAADPEEVAEILAEGWRMNATKRAVEEFDASGELPRLA